MYEVNDKTLAGQILDKSLAEDFGACQVILNQDTSHSLFNSAKSSFFPKDVSQHPDSFSLSGGS